MAGKKTNTFNPLEVGKKTRKIPFHQQKKPFNPWRWGTFQISNRFTTREWIRPSHIPKAEHTSSEKFLGKNILKRCLQRLGKCWICWDFQEDKTCRELTCLVAFLLKALLFDDLMSFFPRWDMLYSSQFPGTYFCWFLPGGTELTRRVDSLFLNRRVSGFLRRRFLWVGVGPKGLKDAIHDISWEPKGTPPMPPRHSPRK